MSARSERFVSSLLVAALVASALGSITGCEGQGPPARPPSDDGGGAVDAGAAPPVAEGAAALYGRLCASCHGEVGQGGLGPRLSDWSRGRASLVEIIDVRMPQGAPDRCDAACSETLADFILARFTTEALACREVPPSPARLRLLTRRELRATVRDLLGLPSSADPEACRTRSFAFDPRGRVLGTVFLAGTFNGWSSTAWPMTYDAGRGAWTLTRALPDGTHQYKFVLDGRDWVRDDANPDTAPDGFGGFNSVVRVDCSATGSTVFDPAAGLPTESRGEDFLFDDDAAAAAITAAHVDALLRASSDTLAQVRGRLGALAGCDVSADRVGCTASFVSGFGRRAFRRPLDADEVARYAALAAAQPSGLDGLGAVLRAMLVSPNFLYRAEIGAPQADGTALLTAYERASALSYQLWGTMPDDALLDAAASGALETPEGLEAQARRLLADPRARGPVGDFAAMWLGVEGLDEQTKRADLFPAWSPALGATMCAATRAFVTSVVFDGSHSLRELFTADWGYADAQLASIYGVSGPTGAALERVGRPGRAGVLGEASVLARYAHSDQTSPIRRGLLVRRNLLCQNFPPPPPDAGGVPDVDPAATTRERFRQHTAEMRCASCHRYIDGIGFGFEGFDALGAARSTEGSMPIDSSGDLNDVEGLGTSTSAPFSTLPELGAVLAGSEAATECFARQYFRFARGYHETLEDRCTIERLAARLRAHGDLRELMIDVVTSPDFVRRRAPGGGL